MDLDDTLREMTVGDLAVPRHVKRAVAVLHDRYATYGAALDGPQDEAYWPPRSRHGLPTLSGAEGLDAARICAYIREAAQALELQPGAQILGGRPRVAASPAR